MKDFLILRYFVSCPCVTDCVNVVYEKYYPREPTQANRGRDDPRNRILTAKEAMQLVREHKMIKDMEDKNGAVWAKVEEVKRA